MRPPNLARAALCGAALCALAVLPAAAQDAPTTRTFLTGYGAVGYNSTVVDPLDRADHDFTGAISLVPLAQVHDDILLAGEVELGLHGNETLLVLEHAEVHYLGFENVQLRAGKFHIPFGIWMHANWVNRMPTPPLLYQDTHGGAASGALMPILFDVGVMGSWNVPLFDGWRTSASVWVTQGPRPGTGGGHTHNGGGDGDDHGGASPSDATPLAYGANYEDNNNDKMIGARFRAVSSGAWTLQGSAFRAAWDDAGDLDVRGLNASVVWAPGAGPQPLFDLRAEATFLNQEYLHHGEVESVDHGGYYVQMSRRFGDFEPVVRWSHLPEAVAGHGPLIERRRQLATGINYWFSPSVPLKAAFQWEADGIDGFFVEWAVGF